MTELELKTKNQTEPTLEELIKSQNIKPVSNMKEFYKQWQPDKEADNLFDFIMQERKERREKIKK